MTQKDLAQKINLPVKTINEIECGKAKHNPQVVSKIKRILNISNK
jgi:ribosome-binding protein aMBF1 (putative translation factor)